MAFLQKGDLIDVVAPAAAYFDYNEAKIHAFVEKLGFKVRCPKEFQKKGADPFSSHTQSIRVQNFKTAMLAEDSKAVWCFRGGYGSTCLIPELDKIDFSAIKKPIIGFSDITALHIYFATKYGLQTIHGRTLSEYFHKKVHTAEINKIQNLLLGKYYDLEITPANEMAKQIPEIRSEIIGGNLTLIENSLGTNWQINSDNKILLVEEAFERGYRIDRSFEHLKQAGLLKKAKAIIIGEIKCAKEEQDRPPKCIDAIKRFTAEATIPVYTTNQIGHGTINNPIIFGKSYTITHANKTIMRPTAND